MAVAAAPDLVLDALLMFGAIGYTWEHDTHLYWRRATSLAASLGPMTHWNREVGELARTLKRSTTINLGDVESEFRARVAATLDEALTSVQRSPFRRHQESRLGHRAATRPAGAARPGRTESAGAVGCRRLAGAAGDHRRGVRQASRVDQTLARHCGVDPPDDPQQRIGSAARALRLADPAWRTAMVPTVQRTRRRLGPGVAIHPRRQGRRGMGGQRAQDLDIAGQSGSVRSAAGAHGSRSEEAPRHQLLPRRHELAGHRGLADQAGQRTHRVQRGLPDRCVRARRHAGR